MERYRIKKVLADDYKPADGEPFAVCWGNEGWVIWCRTPVGGRPKSAKRKQGGKHGNT